VRQACNVAYATLAEGRSDDELEELDISIGMLINPEDEARKALRAHQEATGLVFEDPDAPVAPDPVNLDGEIKGERW
jgi:hypothetical protein